MNHDRTISVVGLGYVGLPVVVAHQQFRGWAVRKIASLMNANPVLVDVKGIHDKVALTAAGFRI